MKKLFCAALVCLLLVGTTSAKVTLPPTTDIRLDNGLTVRIIERHNLPLFSIRMTFRAGAALDPVGKEGVANLCNEMLMRGTTARTDKQIVAEVAFGGGSMTIFCERDRAGISGEFLTEYGAKGFEIIGDVLADSRFAQEEVDKIMTRLLADIQGEMDDPATVANQYISLAILQDSRYAHQPIGTMSSVAGLTRQDVLDFFKKWYSPDNCLLVVCGDVDQKTVIEWLGKYFKDWKGQAATLPAESPFQPTPGAQTLLLNKEDASQTQIRVGLPGLSRSNPDYIPFEAARTILGGSFTSRLVNEIRVNRGLSYNVRCVSNRFIPGGMIYISTFTKNATVSEVVDIILAETKRMQTEPVPDSELTGAINYQNGLYPLGFETNDNLAVVFSSLWLYHDDKSVYEDFQEKMRGVTADKVMAVAKKYFPSADYRLVLVGKADEVKSQVEKYGPVEVRSITEKQQ